MLTTAINMKVLNILQLCDSSFPVGSFNHSFGMETYLRNDIIHNKESLGRWLEVYLRYQFAYSDGLAMRMTYEAIDSGRLDELWKIDRRITVQGSSKESRDGSKMIGQRMIKTYLELHDVPLLREYEKKVKDKSAFGHPAIVTGILMRELKIKVEEALVYYMYSSISTQIQNGVRAIPLGQKDGMQLMQDFFPIFEEVAEEVKKLETEDFGVSIPGLEIAQMNHENLGFRLFMS